jgi:hypothetical protein
MPDPGNALYVVVSEMPYTIYDPECLARNALSNITLFFPGGTAATKIQEK